MTLRRNLPEGMQGSAKPPSRVRIPSSPLSVRDFSESYECSMKRDFGRFCCFYQAIDTNNDCGLDDRLLRLRC